MTHITIDNAKVEIPPNESGHHRGLHVVVINPSSGKISQSQVFDTYESSASFDDFIIYDVFAGDIIVAACRDDCFRNLSENAKQWFSDMGS